MTKNVETKTIEQYEKMEISDLLDMRYDKNTPTEELHKILKVLSKAFHAGTTPCNCWCL